MKVGELTAGEKGESVFRSEASDTITASGFDGEDEIAVEMSVGFSGEPWMIDRPGAGGREVGLRTRAVIVCWAWRAASMKSFPVRPEPPMMRRCILKGLLFRVEFGKELYGPRL